MKSILVKPSLTPFVEYKNENEAVVIHDKRETNVYTVNGYNNFFDVKMRHGIFYNQANESLVKKLRETQYMFSSNSSKIEDFLKDPKNYFSLINIKSCGYSLMANQNIQKGDIVGIYSGELLFFENPVLNVRDVTYDFSIASNVELLGKKYDISCSAKEYGDLTRFAMHLPHEDELKTENIDSSISKMHVLTANMEFNTIYYNGIPIPCYKAIKSIEKNDIAGVDYGPYYWRKRGKPTFFAREKDHIIKLSYDTELKKYMPARKKG